jgi:hypothetical protein
LYATCPQHLLAGAITPDGPIKNQRGISISIIEDVVSITFQVLPSEFVPE